MVTSKRLYLRRADFSQLRERLGKLFWLGAVLTLALTLVPLWIPAVAAREHVHATETTLITTTTSAAGGYNIDNVTAIPIPAGSVLDGTLTITGQRGAYSVPTAQFFYVMTQAEFVAWKPNTGAPTVEDTATNAYVFNSIECTITYPFSFISNSSTVYYFVYDQAIQSGSYGYLGCNAPTFSNDVTYNTPYKIIAPRLDVSDSQDATSAVVTSYETWSGIILGVVALACITVNEAGWRREKKKSGS